MYPLAYYIEDTSSSSTACLFIHLVHYLCFLLGSINFNKSMGMIDNYMYVNRGICEL